MHFLIYSSFLNLYHSILFSGMSVFSTRQNDIYLNLIQLTWAKLLIFSINSVWKCGYPQYPQ